MLLQVASVIAALVVLAGALSGAAAAFAHVRMSTAVDAYLSAGEAAAEESLSQTVQSAEQNTIKLSNAPTSVPGYPKPLSMTVPQPCVQSGGGPDCHYSVLATATLEGTTLNVAGFNPGQGSTGATAYNLQAGINEQVIAYRLFIVVQSDANGSDVTVGTKTVDITFRTFYAAPFATVVGSQQQGETLGGVVQADSAGCDPYNPTSCGGNSPNTMPDDTRIWLVDVNQQTGQTTPAPSNTFVPTTAWQNGASVNNTGWSH